jgi:hypothetical protein
LPDDVPVADVDEDVVVFWERWWLKWHRRIRCIVGGTSRPPGRRRRHRTIRAADVSTAWTRVFMPAFDPEYVMPEWWLELTAEEKRTATARPQPELRPRRARPASEAAPGFSFDDVGAYFKLADGSVFRDRRTAAHRLWRRMDRVPDLRRVIGWLPGRSGREGRLVRGRTPDRVLDALVCYGLVHAGMSQAAAAETVLRWAGTPGRSPEKLADRNRLIWRELRLTVSE